MIEEGRIRSVWVRVLEIKLHVGCHILLIGRRIDAACISHGVKHKPFFVMNLLHGGIVQQRGKIHSIGRSACGLWEVKPVVAALSAWVFFGAETRGIAREIMWRPRSMKLA